MMNCYFQNIRGLRSKIYDLELLCSEHMIDVVALQETWLNENIEIKMKGYKIFRQDRNNNTRGGGVVIFCRETMDAIMVNSNDIMGIEDRDGTQFLTVRIRMKNGEMLK